MNNKTPHIFESTLSLDAIKSAYRDQFAATYFACAQCHETTGMTITHCFPQPGHDIFDGDPRPASEDPWGVKLRFKCGDCGHIHDIRIYQKPDDGVEQPGITIGVYH